MENDEYIIQKAFTHYESAEYSEAIKTIAELAMEKKYAPQYYELTGFCYFELQQWENAVWYLEKTTGYYPGHSLLHDKLGLAYFNAGQNDKALQKIQYLYNTYPGSDLFCFRYGFFEYTQARYNTAAAFFSESAAVNPEVHVEINYYIGVCHYNLQQWNDALPYLLAQTEKDEEHPDCHYFIGSCYYNLHNYEAAIHAFSQALWYNEKDLHALWFRYLAKKATENYKDAEKDLARIVEMNPEFLKAKDEAGNPIKLLSVTVNPATGNLEFKFEKKEEKSTKKRKRK